MRFEKGEKCICLICSTSHEIWTRAMTVSGCSGSPAFVVCCTEAWGWFFDVLLPAGFRSCMGGAVRSLGGVCDSRVGDSCLFLFLLLGRQCLDDFGLFIRPGLLSRDGDEHVLRPTSSLSSPVWGSRAAACRLVCARCCRSACFCALCVPRLFLGFGFGVGVV